ncbi:MAG TPA: hypothetical protein PKC39_00150 [Ferruginibacter sp.]|nr:hypothetical protein [Ferruginibacter sp.]HMP19340.1 hypothetical protein [Ferruginibacter sp.]
MKEIKNISQLRREKKRLQQQQYRLEQDISSNWQALKHSLKPSAALAGIIGQGKSPDTLAESIISKALHIGAGVLAKKISDKAAAFIRAYCSK